ncbi:MAG: PhzF family phenazine biosynthesis protein [Firmicutes bacterium]|nr:PhzF family phenazine biosynthesis protein [Bacillota bacterium]
MGIKIYQVDAFTNKPFAGNPAAVCMLTEPKGKKWMQGVAREMNLSETAFLLKIGDGYNLRWFTPTVEVDLCGHATLASAHILWEKGYLEAGKEARFDTKSGLLTASKKNDWIELDFPAEPPQETSAPDELIKALGVTPNFVGKNRVDYIIEVEDAQSVQNIQPDFNLLKKLNIRGIMVTSQLDADKYDFVSRFFAPGVGVDEDPVTGSAHCCLGPYWKERLNKDEFMAYQASERGGFLKVRVNGERVILGGQAVTVLCGELT